MCTLAAPAFCLVSISTLASNNARLSSCRRACSTYNLSSDLNSPMACFRVMILKARTCFSKVEVNSVNLLPMLRSHCCERDNAWPVVSESRILSSSSAS
ncbi:hypothetical protein HanRHA438_Chr08g0352761 [Helianthus annuus]|nr:hypothetical protein HanIR_Chr08g0368571 [Helianthus annuus]KAJ0898076.1 hypothetical protein HanRHA438_Chr08g0352761 [Helianthus annuus]